MIVTQSSVLSQSRQINSVEERLKLDRYGNFQAALYS